LFPWINPGADAAADFHNQCGSVARAAAFEARILWSWPLPPLVRMVLDGEIPVEIAPAAYCSGYRNRLVRPGRRWP
jgi:hypothetical protein